MILRLLIINNDNSQGEQKGAGDVEYSGIEQGLTPFSGPERDRPSQLDLETAFNHTPPTNW